MSLLLHPVWAHAALPGLQRPGRREATHSVLSAMQCPASHPCRPQPAARRPQPPREPPPATPQTRAPAASNANPAKKAMGSYSKDGTKQAARTTAPDAAIKSVRDSLADPDEAHQAGVAAGANIATTKAPKKPNPNPGAKKASPGKVVGKVSRQSIKDAVRTKAGPPEKVKYTADGTPKAPATTAAPKAEPAAAPPAKAAEAPEAPAKATAPAAEAAAGGAAASAAPAAAKAAPAAVADAPAAVAGRKLLMAY